MGVPTTAKVGHSYRKRGCCNPSYGGFRGRLVPPPPPLGSKTLVSICTWFDDLHWCDRRPEVDELLLMWDVPEIVSKGLSPEDKVILEVSDKVPMRVRRAVCLSLTRLLRSLLVVEDPPVEGVADAAETVERAPAALESEQAMAPRLKDPKPENVLSSVACEFPEDHEEQIHD
jgi:hypothetical protein